MAISPADITKAINALDAEIQALGVDTQFTLRGGGTFTIRTLTSNKRDENLTEGLQQDGFDIKFMANRWRASAPATRWPEKGDQLLRNGRRHAIEFVYLQSAGTTEVGFICRVLG